MFEKQGIRRHHRRSIRLRGFDYAGSGWYYVTICTKNKEWLFGDIENKNVRLSGFGRIVHDEWLQSSVKRAYVELDEFVIMPNHVHGIIIIKDVVPHDVRTAVRPYAPRTNGLRSPSHTLGSIVRGFKTSAAKRINIERNSRGEPVWQRNYYEHIIRDDRSLERIRQYIHNNPEMWHRDRNNSRNR